MAACTTARNRTRTSSGTCAAFIETGRPAACRWGAYSASGKELCQSSCSGIAAWNSLIAAWHSSLSLKAGGGTISTISIYRTSGLGKLNERTPPLNPPGGQKGVGPALHHNNSKERSTTRARTSAPLHVLVTVTFAWSFYLSVAARQAQVSKALQWRAECQEDAF